MSPLVDPSGPANGPLIKYVHRGSVAPVGTGDGNVMAYSFRYCLTKDQSNQAPFLAPKGYNASDFLLFRRTVAAYAAHNRSTGVGNIYGLYSYHSHVAKWDLCDSQDFPVTSDAPQENIGYWNGTRAFRQSVAEKHYYYVSGMLYCLAHDPECVEIPAASRANANMYGLCKDEW